MIGLVSETRRFAYEVSMEAARLMKHGMPLWDALVQARQIVSKRRSEQTPIDNEDCLR